MTIDTASPKQLTWYGVHVRLTPSQARFLCLLARHPGRVLTHNQIYTHLYKYGEIVEPQMVNWHKHTLCRWVAAATGHPLPIVQLPRRGYCLQLDANQIDIIQEEIA